MCFTALPGMGWSPRQQLDGQSVLVTGSLGFLGSVVLEQILRLTKVEKVYLLVRGKKHLTAAQRVERMLCLPLFHVLHEDARKGRQNAFKKVQAVEGDLTLPGLGLSQTDAAALRKEVSVIIHCAADIELDAQVHKTLKANYLGTRGLLELAAGMQNLRVFLHTSTYFVNSHLPRHTVVKEQIYRLPLSLPEPGMTQPQYTAAADTGKLSVTHSDFVSAMLERPAEDADQQTAMVMQRLNFASSYAFGKYLTELLVEEFPLPGRVSKVMVRPSLISNIAGAPYPGYVSGYGGPAGYTMGYAVGFFPHITSVAYGSDYIMDLIPADTVAAVLVTAAAAGLVSSSQGGTERSPGVAVYHAASADSYTAPLKLVFDVISAFWEANPPPLSLPLTRYVTLQSVSERLEPNTLFLQLGRWVTLAKIWGVSWVLSALGKTREARLLSMAYKAFNVYNSRRYDRSITCSVDNVRSLQAQMTPEDRQMLPVVWEESIMKWHDYGYTACAGIRRLLFNVEQDSVRPAGCIAPVFQSWPAADASVLHLSAPSAPADVAASPDAVRGGRGDDQQSKAAATPVVNLTAKAVNCLSA